MLPILETLAGAPHSFAEMLHELAMLNFDMVGLTRMLMYFCLNLLSVWIIVKFLYYPKSRKRSYYFTFMLLSVSIFTMLYLMQGLKMEIGAALGLFAVFGILRYRTEGIPIREMTYLFYLVGLSVVNGTTQSISFVEHIIMDGMFILVAALMEGRLYKGGLTSKYVKYDNIELIKPDKRDELIADLQNRLGFKIERVEVGAVDFLQDCVILRVHYVNEEEVGNTVNHMMRMK